MKCLTGYVWQPPQIAFDGQKSCRESSILLQQISYGKCNVTFACVCGGGVGGSYVTGGLKSWLMKCGNELFLKRVEKNIVKKELEKELRRLCNETRSYYDRLKGCEMRQIDLSGILIADQECWLMQTGKGMIMLLNRKFQRTHCKRIKTESSDPIQVTEAGLQKCVGVLLGDGSFLQCVSGEALTQCLAPQDIHKEEQIDRRLAELAGESRRQGYDRECSAVYVRSV